VAHGSKAPKDHGAGVSDTCPDTVDESANNQQAHCICSCKGEHEISVLDFVPSEFMLERALQKTQDLPVHIVLSSAEKKQRANYPADMADPRNR
jgi:hypothetical protein